jgi:hypothetical protein
MSEINLDPQVGEEVSLLGHWGRFKITKVDPCIDNPRLTRYHGWVDVSELVTGFRHERIPVEAILYDEDRPVYRAIEALRQSPESVFPKYVVDYTIETGEDHYGNPAFFVRFFVDADDQPSPEKIKELNRFRDVVETKLLSLSLNRRPFVLIKEKRSLLDVAS